MSSQEKWVSLFEKVIGRKPSPQEFFQGKASGFDLKKIKEIAQGGASPLQTPSGPSQESYNPSQPESLQVESDVETVKNAPKKMEEKVRQKSDSPQPASISPSKRPLRKRLLGFGLALLLLAGAGLVYLGYVKTKPEVQLEALQSAVQAEDYATVSSLISSSQEEWKDDDAKAFVSYLESKDGGLNAVLEQVKTTGLYEDQNANKLLGLSQVGKKWVFFPDYHFQTYPLELLVTSELDDTMIDDNDVETGEEVAIKGFHFIPSRVSVEGKSPFADVETDLPIDPDQAKGNQLVLSLELESQDFVASLPFEEDAIEEPVLYVNGTKVADGLTANLMVLPDQVADVKVSFKVGDQTFETLESQVNLSDEGPVSLTLEEDQLKAIEDILKKEAQKRQPQVLWNANKSQQLADFMVSWGNSMNQPNYMDITDYERGFVEGNLVRINQVQNVTTEFSQDGTGNSDYQVLAIYRYGYGGNQMHTYYFTIRADGAPVVLYSAQNQGQPDGKYDMKETANADLKAGFATIVAQ